MVALSIPWHLLVHYFLLGDNGCDELCLLVMVMFGIVQMPLGSAYSHHLLQSSLVIWLESDLVMNFDL